MMIFDAKMAFLMQKPNIYLRGKQNGIIWTRDASIESIATYCAIRSGVMEQ